MTLYTYKCGNCGEFQEFREENDRTKCKCGKPVKKVFGGAFKLRGSDFYSNERATDRAI